MKFDIIIIGGGASGLMAACKAASQGAGVAVLEKMPRPGRKIMITGKGRCNFTNLKPWNEFSAHIRSGAAFVRPAFYGFPPEMLMDFFIVQGVPPSVERGDRVFPESHRAVDIVDALVSACRKAGVSLLTGCKVVSVVGEGEVWRTKTAEGEIFESRRLIIATGGLSYPATGSDGDGYIWAREAGHTLAPLFPSLTALVPAGYKEGKGHIDRSVPLTPLGKSLEGISLKNIGLSAEIGGHVSESLFGDMDFTDGGIEGPLGFALSRDCVNALVNGNKVRLLLDMKPAVDENELSSRIDKLAEGSTLKALCARLLPSALVLPFLRLHPGLDSKTLAAALKRWTFDIAGYVGYERAVVTAGGVRTAEVYPKTMESRLAKGLYFCGEVLDIDSDTGGYNLQTAFSTGALAGLSAAMSLKQ